MFKQRIVLINGSRLLRDLLHMVIRKAEHLDIVKEVHKFDDLPHAMEDTEAEWVVITLPDGEVIPAWVDAFIAAHPTVRFLIISNDASRIRMKWSEPHEEDLQDMPLRDLIQILEAVPHREHV